jgi:hypothetical protein
MAYEYPMTLSEDIEARLDLEDYELALERIQNPEGDSTSLEDVITHLDLVDSV